MTRRLDSPSSSHLRVPCFTRIWLAAALAVLVLGSAAQLRAATRWDSGQEGPQSVSSPVVLEAESASPAPSEAALRDGFSPSEQAGWNDGRGLGFWEGRGPWGGNVRWLLADPNDAGHVLCAAGLSQASESGGVWESSDGGATWNDTGLFNIPVYGLAASLSQPDLFFAAAYRGLHKSTDGGATWAAIAFQSQFVLGAGVKADDPQVLIAGLSSDQGIRRSTDGGATWNTVGLNSGYFKGYGASALDPDRMYVALSSEPYAVYRSDDGGATWTGAGPAGCSGYGLYVDPSDPDRVFVTVAVDGTAGIYRSLDGGGSWVRVLNGSGYAPVVERAGVLYAAINGQGIYESTNNGDTWSLNTNGIVASFWQAGANAASGALFGHWGGIYSGEGTGGTWSVSQTGLNNAYVRSIAYYQDTHELWACLDQSGLWKSTDGGVSWEMSSAGLPTWTLHAIAPPDHARFSNPRMALATDIGVFLSDDGGQTWTAGGLAGQSLTEVAVHWTDPQILWAGLSTAGVSYSTNGGSSWAASGGLPFCFYPDIDLVDGPMGLRVLVCYQERLGNPGAVHYSDDMGATFSAGTGLEATTNQPELSVRRSGGSLGAMVYCATNNGVYRSADAGATWTRAGTVGGLMWSVLGTSGTEVWAGRQGMGGYHSSDEGDTWELLNAGAETATFWTMTHGAASNLTYAGTRGRGVVWIEVEAGSAPWSESALSEVRAWPNPFSRESTLRFLAPRAGEVTVAVFDASGRRVAGETFRAQPGEGAWTWPGLDAAGSPVPAGAYYYSLRGAGIQAGGSWIIVR